MAKKQRAFRLEEELDAELVAYANEHHDGDVTAAALDLIRKGLSGPPVLIGGEQSASPGSDGRLYTTIKAGPPSGTVAALDLPSPSGRTKAGHRLGCSCMLCQEE